jgi:hypothetical protein
MEKIHLEMFGAKDNETTILLERFDSMYFWQDSTGTETSGQSSVFADAQGEQLSQRRQAFKTLMYSLHLKIDVLGLSKFGRIYILNSV